MFYFKPSGKSFKHFAVYKTRGRKVEELGAESRAGDDIDRRAEELEGQHPRAVLLTYSTKPLFRQKLGRN